jgi:hypothetical protein
LDLLHITSTLRHSKKKGGQANSKANRRKEIKMITVDVNKAEKGKKVNNPKSWFLTNINKCCN